MVRVGGNVLTLKSCDCVLFSIFKEDVALVQVVFNWTPHTPGQGSFLRGLTNGTFL